MHRPIFVTARLTSPLAGKPPRLDALLEYVLSLYHAKGEPGYKITRDAPAPRPDAIPIPIRREWLGGHYVARCSDAILAPAQVETAEYVAKKLEVAHAGLLSSGERKVVATTNTWTKSYRLPLRMRLVPAIRWFAVGDRRETLKCLRRVDAIGKKVADGYGRVAGWEIDEADEDRSWYARTPETGGLPLLMATLPVGDWLPDGLVGARRSYGAASPPYWHPGRYAEIVEPC